MASGDGTQINSWDWIHYLKCMLGFFEGQSEFTILIE
jgi:hypothetical protein